MRITSERLRTFKPSDDARAALNLLRMGITVNGELKGYLPDEDGELCKTYLTPDQARQIARGLVEAANWIDGQVEGDF